MKFVKILFLSGLIVSSLPVYAHTHEELEGKISSLETEVKLVRRANDALKEAAELAGKAIAAKKEHNDQLIQELNKSWGWKKKAGMFLAGLVVGHILTLQGGKSFPQNSIQGLKIGNGTLEL